MTISNEQLAAENAALRTRLEKVELILGDWDHPPLLSLGKTPKELGSGQYPLNESDYQLHAFANKVVGDPGVPGDGGLIGELKAAIEQLKGELASLKSSGQSITPATVTPTTAAPAPAPTGPTMPGLSATDITNVIEATKAARKALPNNWVGLWERVIDELGASPPIYSTAKNPANADFVESVREIYYPLPMLSAQHTALYNYLQIIDQRDAAGHPLPAGDERWASVSGSAVTPTPSPAPQGGVLPLVRANGATAQRDTVNRPSVVIDDAVAASMEAQNAQIFGGPVAFLGPVGFGGQPLAGHPLTIRRGGEVSFLAKTPSAETQEKSGDKWRAGSFSISTYDKGARMVSGGLYIDGVMHRTEDVVDILGFDSQGVVSKSHENYAEGTMEACQDWTVRPDPVRKVYTLEVCRAGWGVEVGASTATRNFKNPNGNDRAALLVEPLPGAV